MAGLQAERTASIGLTTTRAPFIEQAQAEGRLYIHQPYELYSEANHDAWRRLFTRMEDRWRRYANPRFLQGIDNLCLDPRAGAEARGRQPISQPAHRLQGQAGERVRSVLPLLRLSAQPRVSHHDHHPRRRHARLPPEPDIFHDIAGHVPMHTDRAFADTLVRFGDCAHTAAEIVAGITRRAGEDPARHQHLQGAGAVLLVHDRVRPDAGAGRAQGLRQRAAQLPRRDRARDRLARWCSATRSSSSG